MSAADPDPKLAFFRDGMRAVLQRCVACHGGVDPAAGLTLATRAAALVPGHAAGSLLVQRADELRGGAVVEKGRLRLNGKGV